MNAAISGLEAHQTMLDVTASNLANVDTIGYKAQRTTFEDELSQTISPASAPSSANGDNGGTGGSNSLQVGLGVQIGSIDNLMSQGSAQTTGNALDVEIQGDGFLQVATSNGASTAPVPATDSAATSTALQTAARSGLNTADYTRAGNLQISSNGYLTTQSGQYVIGSTSAGTQTDNTTQTLLRVPTGATDVAIAKNGAVTYTDTNNQPQTAGYIQLASFPNEAGLSRDGGSDWSATSNSGAANRGTPTSAGFGGTISGELEASNVDMATEFSNMITAERGYQANSKVITTADDMLQTVVNMVQ